MLFLKKRQLYKDANPVGQRFAPSSGGGSIGRAHGMLANAERCCSAATGQFLKSIHCFSLAIAPPAD
jgi:hypothetical protein